jgi:O-antigen/teichoic acid export membrane protein
MPCHNDRAFGFIGLGLSGVAAYAFLAVAGRALGPATFGPVGALWSVVFLATAAFAAPVELAVSRSVATARGRFQPWWPATLSGLIVAAGITIPVGSVAMLASGSLDRTAFGGQEGFAAVATFAFAGLMTGAVLKGACTGSGRLAGWGGYLLADGATRLLLSAVAAAVAPMPIAFAVSIAVGPWVALLPPVIWLRQSLAARRGVVTRDSVADMALTTLPLVVAAAAAAALTYLGAVLLPMLEPGPDARVGATIGAISLARVPLFALSPFVAVAVPRIAFAAETGNRDDALRSVAVLIGVALAAGVLVIVVAAWAGAGTVSLVFGPLFQISSGSLDAIAIAAAGWLIATAAASVSIALRRGRLAIVAWSVGLIAAVVGAAAFGPDPFARTDAAMALGSVAAATAALATAGVAIRAVIPRTALPALS